MQRCPQLEQAVQRWQHTCLPQHPMPGPLARTHPAGTNTRRHPPAVCARGEAATPTHPRAAPRSRCADALSGWHRACRRWAPRQSSGCPGPRGHGWRGEHTHIHARRTPAPPLPADLSRTGCSTLHEPACAASGNPHDCGAEHLRRTVQTCPPQVPSAAPVPALHQLQRRGPHSPASPTPVVALPEARPSLPVVPAAVARLTSAPAATRHAQRDLWQQQCLQRQPGCATRAWTRMTLSAQVAFCALGAPEPATSPPLPPPAAPVVVPWQAPLGERAPPGEPEPRPPGCATPVACRQMPAWAWSQPPRPLPVEEL